VGPPRYVFLDGVPRADIILPGQLPHLIREANLEISRSKERSSILRRELKAAALFSEENAVTISLWRDGEDGMDIDAVVGAGVAGSSGTLIEGAIVGPDMERKRKRPGRKRKKPLPGDDDKGKAKSIGDAASKLSPHPVTGGGAAPPDAKKAKTSSATPAASTTSRKPPPPKPKSARDVLRRILRKYPEIADDPVYVAALRNVGLEVPSLREMQQMVLKQKMVAAAAAATAAAGGGGSVEVGSSKKKVKKDTSSGAGAGLKAGKVAKQKEPGEKAKAKMIEDAPTRMRREIRELRLAVGEVA